MDNSVKKLTMMLEPLVFDLDDQKAYLEERKKELENVSRFLAYTKDNVDMVGIYADQDLVLSCLPNIYCDKDEYKASCYLLKSEDENIRSLPQFAKARNLVSDIVEYFKLYKSELMVETQDLKKSCDAKEVEKKYYDIFTSPHPLVNDVDEFKNLLDTHNIQDDDKINILLYTIKNNIKQYGIKE